MPEKTTPAIINNRVFYTIIIILTLIQAAVIQKNISSKAIMFLFLLAFILLFFGSLSKPEIAIMGLTIYIPFSKIIIGHIATAINFTNSFIIIIFLGWFISHEYREEKFIIPTPLNFPFILFALFGLISLIQGGVMLPHIEGHNLFFLYWRWFTPMLMFFLTINNIEDKDSIKKVIILVLITATVVGLMSIKSYLDLGHFSSWEKARIGGISDQPNSLGAYFVNYTPILLGIFVINRISIKNLLLLIPIIICARAVHVTFSRGAWLAYGVANSFVAIVGKSKKIIIIGILIFVFFAVNPTLIPESIRNRLEMTFTDSHSPITIQSEQKLEKSVSDRLIIWNGALRMIKTHPLMGMGYGTFPYFIMDYSKIGEEKDAHNTFLKIGAEMGIPALITFISILIIIFINTLWVYKHAKTKFFRGASLGFLGSTIGLVVSCMFGSRMNTLEIIGQYWILAGVIFRLKMILEREELEEYGEKVKKLKAET